MVVSLALASFERWLEEDNLLPVLLFFSAEEISLSTARTKALIVLGKSFARFLVTRNYSSLHSVVRSSSGNEVCVGVGVMMVNQMLLRVLWLFLGFDELFFSVAECYATS